MAILVLLADAILKSLVLLGLAWAATALLRRASASLRHLVWLGSLGAVLALPILPALVPGWTVSLPEAFSTAGTEPVAEEPTAVLPADDPILNSATAGVVGGREIAPSTSERAEPSVPSALPVSSIPETTTREAEFPWSAMLLGLWLAVGLLVAARHLLGLAAAWRIARAGEPFDAPWALALAREVGEAQGLREEIPLKRSAATPVPFLWGLVRPGVILPAEARLWAPEDLEAVLHHELAHLRRRDHLSLHLAPLACALVWANPLVWLARRRLEAEREQSCDDAVVAAGIRPSTYARQLLDAAGRLGRSGPVPALALARRATVEDRIRSILDPRKPRGGPSPMTKISTTFSIVLLALLLASVRPGADSSAHAADSSSPGAAAAAALEDLGGEDLEALARALRSGDWEARKPGNAPSDFDDRRAVEPLIAALEDPDPAVRRLAAWGLSEIRDRRAVEALERRLADDDPAVRGEAARALGDIGGSVPLEAMLVSLDDPDAEVRFQTAHALGDLQDPRSLDGLVAALDDPDDDVRAKVDWAVREILDRYGVSALIEAMDHPNPRVRLHASHFLGDKQSERSVDVLLRGLEDSSPEVRLKAAWALGEVASRDAVSALIVRAEDAGEAMEMRQMAIRCLGQIGDAAAAPALLGLLSHEDWRIRAQAADALGDVDVTEAIAPLEAALRDDSEVVRREARKALRKIR